MLRMSARQDVMDDGRRLKDQLSRFQDEDGKYLRDELSTIKQELRALRDKNGQLMADNIKLTEHLRRYDSKSQNEHSHSPSRRENRRPDPLLDGGHDGWSPTVKSNCEDDEHFTRERRRITHELRELSTPPTWSDRDYRNHGDETPYIRTANQNPYSRNKMETSKDSDKFRHRDMDVQMLGKDQEPDKFVTERRVDTVTNQYRDPDRYRDSLPGRERTTDRRLENVSDRDDIGTRPGPRTPERVQVNGHVHRSDSPPAVRRERRLSDRSDSTVELTDASPLGEYRPLDQHVPSDDFRKGIIEERLSHGTLITPGSHQLTNDTSTLHDLLPLKKRDPISDVMDNLSQPPNTRRRLKVDLVNDIIDSANVLPNRPVIVGRPDHTGSSNSQALREYDYEKLESQVTAPDHIQRHNSSNHGSVLDDLLDNSMEDVNGIPSRPRRDSLDSDSTEVILGIAEEEMNKYNIARDSSGSDHQIINGKSRGLHHGTSLRSVSPRPIITQHNKGTLGVTQSHKESIHSCATKRPFAPRVAADVNIGDVVKFCRHGGKISKGLVRYIGHLPGKNDTYLGLELEHEMGKHDGVYEGQRYFQSKPNRGVFVAFSKVVMAWGE